MTFGSAVLRRRALVAAMLRTSSGRADQSSATTPTTCGPAIEVPFRETYSESPVTNEERTPTPGATTSGLSRNELSTRTGPRLLKGASVLLLLRIAPVVKVAS